MPIIKCRINKALPLSAQFLHQLKRTDGIAHIIIKVAQCLLAMLLQVISHTVSHSYKTIMRL